MSLKKLLKIAFLSFAAAAVLSGCASVPSASSGQENKEELQLSRKIMDKGRLSEKSLYRYFMSENPKGKKSQVKRLAKYYIEESNAEGINSDAAFAQMCLETGYLTFGNLVVPKMHNYCGLGAMDREHPGCWFKTERLGVRAHIQHLQAYGTTEETALNQELVDPRYSWVHKTKYAETVFDLAGVWATDKLYGEKIDAILNKMEKF